MSNNPEDIKRDIEATREELSRDVDALSEKVSPARVLERRVDKAKDAVSGVKDKVMGVAAPAATPAAAAAGTAAQRPSRQGFLSRFHRCRTARRHRIARSQTRGNPLAAGLIAFGVGWLASSLLPATQKEQDVAVAVKETRRSNTRMRSSSRSPRPRRDEGQPARAGAARGGSVKSTAQDAAANVQDEARSATGRQVGQHSPTGVARRVLPIG